MAYFGVQESDLNCRERSRLCDLHKAMIRTKLEIQQTTQCLGRGRLVKAYLLPLSFDGVNNSALGFHLPARG
jgi:hypothetical protein